MSKSYDIFLSHSGAQKDFVEQLFLELTRHGQYSVFFDKNSLNHGDSIKSNIVEHATTCKMAVAVLSEDYFIRSKSPMLELAASYTASTNANGVPCLLPVFLELKPEQAKTSERQSKWVSTWGEWRRNELMSDRSEHRKNWVEPEVWRKALDKLLDTRGLVYKPHENSYKSALFAQKVARDIACKLDALNNSKVSYKAKESVEHNKAKNLSDSVVLEHSSKNLNGSLQCFDGMEKASTSGGTHMEAYLEFMERKRNVVQVRERKVEARERSIDEREKEKDVLERKRMACLSIGERRESLSDFSRIVNRSGENDSDSDPMIYIYEQPDLANYYYPPHKW